MKGIDREVDVTEALDTTISAALSNNSSTEAEEKKGKKSVAPSQLDIGKRAGGRDCTPGTADGSDELIDETEQGSAGTTASGSTSSPRPGAAAAKQQEDEGGRWFDPPPPLPPAGQCQKEDWNTPQGDRAEKQLSDKMKESLSLIFFVARDQMEGRTVVCYLVSFMLPTSRL